MRDARGAGRATMRRSTSGGLRPPRRAVVEKRSCTRPGRKRARARNVIQSHESALEQQLRDADAQSCRPRRPAGDIEVQLNNDLLAQQAARQHPRPTTTRRRCRRSINEALAKDQLVSKLVRNSRRWTPTRLACAPDFRRSAPSKADSMRAQMAVQHVAGRSGECAAPVTQQQRDELKVRAGLDGMLAARAVESASRWRRHEPGAGREPSRLKAEIKIGRRRPRTSSSVRRPRSIRATASSKAASPPSIRRSRTVARRST